MNPRHIVMVGAGIGGLRTAEALRDGGFTGRITLVGAEEQQPYTRPPLSKNYLRGDSESVLLRTNYGSADLQLILGRRAISLDTTSARVELDDGRTLPYDAVVLATGARARVWPDNPTASPRLHVLRTVDDAHRLRSALTSTERLTIIGGGVLGCEVAATVRSAGLSVDLIEARPALLAGAIGHIAAHHVTDLHRTHGVDVHVDTSVSHIHDDKDALTISLGDGTDIRTPHALVALGASPNTEWLSGSGLDAGPAGIVCDASGRTNIPNVLAVGDAAAWFHPLTGQHRRVEHWTSTVEQAAVVATTLLGGDTHLRTAPYFWSDQYDVRIQASGFIDPATEVASARAGTAKVLLHAYDGVLTGVVGFNSMRSVIRLGRLVTDRGSLDEALQFLNANHEIQMSGALTAPRS